ncbi:MAG: hypothetical protein J7498_13335 [Sphingobium sp.]|nr:hypothetical protein [Sphingobium sp.]
MAHRRLEPHWWERLFPFVVWLTLASLMLALVRLLLRLGINDPRVTIRVMRLASHLSRIGFRVWRAREPKWPRS